MEFLIGLTLSFFFRIKATTQKKITGGQRQRRQNKNNLAVLFPRHSLCRMLLFNASALLPSNLVWDVRASWSNIMVQGSAVLHILSEIIR